MRRTSLIHVATWSISIVNSTSWVVPLNACKQLKDT
jgi:hypothetical protein